MATPFLDPSPDRLGPQERHPADMEVGIGEPAGGALALEGSATDPEPVGKLVQSKREPPRESIERRRNVGHPGGQCIGLGA
jgi:hypothetical protein